ncbi:MAG TPA: hypothetical protein VG652_01765 [Gaiellaceae bacterium]|nr:hypothetical protein [Gaiellaceae bacterium]
MTDLDRSLSALAAEIEWPETPRLELQLEPHSRRSRGWVVVLAVIALAVAVSFAVPPARSAILRFFHLGGVTIERVDVLPPAQEESLAASLGRPVTSKTAAQVLGAPFKFPPAKAAPPLYLEEGVVSALLATPSPVLLTELRTGGPGILKKLIGVSTGVESFQITDGEPAIWISGVEHIFIGPDAPPRLAGHTLVWVAGNVTYRLEGRGLTMDAAVKLAHAIDGT